MPDKRLVDYIQKYHSQGYSITTLKDFLINQGYASAEVEGAIRESYGPMHPGKNRLFLILTIVAGLIILIALFFLIGSFFKDEVAILDIRLSAEDDYIEKGNAYNLQVQLINRGKKKEYPVMLNFRIDYEGAFLDEKSRSVSLSDGTIDFTYEPENIGDYEIEVIASYEGKQITRIMSFSVVSVCGDGDCDPEENCPADCYEPVCGDGRCDSGENCSTDCYEPICGDGICQSGEDCLEDCNGPECGDGVCQENEDCEADCGVEDLCGNGICDSGEDSILCEQDCPEETAICGNNVCEIGESTTSCPDDCRYEVGISSMSGHQLTKYVPEQVKKNGAKSTARECNQIPEPKNKDTCFYWVMKASNSSEYCKYIESVTKQDDCYISYSYTTDDYSNCEQVTDQSKRETCEFLKSSYDFKNVYEDNS